MRAVPLGALQGLSARTAWLDLERSALDRLLADDLLARFRAETDHYKPIEYLTTLGVLDLQDGQVLLDAGGGPVAEFLRLARNTTGRNLQLICQDARLRDGTMDGVTLLGGRMTDLPLGSGSVDAVVVHQAFQLLRADDDVRFIHEAHRVLRPGGRLVITPLLIGTTYVEIWNRWRTERYDPDALTIRDLTAASAGWGPFSGFSRVLDPPALQRRLLERLPAGVEATIYGVRLDGLPVPNRTRNRNLPAFNDHMKCLVLTAAR